MPCFVYFIQAENGGPVKIGIALSPSRRLAVLQTGHPYRLVVRRAIELASEDEARDMESRLHDLFRADRLHGEWFNATPAIAALGDAVADDAPVEAVTYPESSGFDGESQWSRWGRKAESTEGQAQYKADALELERLMDTDDEYRAIKLTTYQAPLTARPDDWEPDCSRSRI